MKIQYIIMLCLGFLFTVQPAWAQRDKRAERKTERAEKKRLKEEALLENKVLLLDFVKEQSYVLEATTLSGRYGRQYQVSPNTNFVMVDGNQIVIQTANNFGIGYNGLGGITINGTIRDYQIQESKNGVSVMIQFSDPVMGFSTLNLDVQSSGYARASVLGNWGGRAVFQGQLVSLDASRVFEGRPVI